MNRTQKSNAQILEKLQIKELNSMQKDAYNCVSSNHNMILLSPTGTGKTLAFLLPLLEKLDSTETEIQALILVPSRELALQIEQVFREMGTGYKANAIYGGRTIQKDFIDLNHLPAVLIGTPGRIADHLRRETFETSTLKTLVLDEFDKSLEVGFEDDMKFILKRLYNPQKLLTSATQNVEVPRFVELKEHKTLDFLHLKSKQLEILNVEATEKDKLKSLYQLLCNIGEKPGIVFCNFKDTISFVSDFLKKKNIPHGTFYGGMEQQDRERALIKFRNGTYRILLATDLAARGLDVPELNYIIHYQLPIKEEEFTHRNGRTARMNANGIAYVLQYSGEKRPEFIPNNKTFRLEKVALPETTKWETLFISGGRKDKISKSDIVGFLIKKGKLNSNEIGTIELKQDCAFVAVKEDKIFAVIDKLNNTFIKKRKVRLYTI